MKADFDKCTGERLNNSVNIGVRTEGQSWGFAPLQDGDHAERFAEELEGFIAKAAKNHLT